MSPEIMQDGSVFNIHKLQWPGKHSRFYTEGTQSQEMCRLGLPDNFFDVRIKCKYDYLFAYKIK